MFALITGGSSGIGLAMARELGRRGYDLLLVSRTASRLDAAAASLHEDTGHTVVTHAVDLSAHGAAQALFDWIGEQQFDVEVLVNNAGAFLFNDVVATSPERLESFYTLDVETPLLFCRLFGEAMAARSPQRGGQRGYILNVSSYSICMPWPGLAVYSSAKSAVHTLSLAMSREMRERDVYVTATAPAAVATGLVGLTDHWMRIGQRLGVIMSADKVARISLRALFRGRRQVIPGWYYRPLMPLLRHMGPAATRLLRKKTLRFQK